MNAFMRALIKPITIVALATVFWLRRSHTSLDGGFPLATPVRPQRIDALPLRECLARLSTAADVPMRTNWSDRWPYGLTADTPVTCDIPAGTLLSALDKVRMELPSSAVFNCGQREGVVYVGVYVPQPMELCVYDVAWAAGRAADLRVMSPAKGPRLRVVATRYGYRYNGLTPAISLATNEGIAELAERVADRLDAVGSIDVSRKHVYCLGQRIIVRATASDHLHVMAFLKAARTTLSGTPANHP